MACGVGWRVRVGRCGGCRRSRHVAANGADKAIVPEICNSTRYLQYEGQKSDFIFFFARMMVTSEWHAADWAREGAGEGENGESDQDDAGMVIDDD